MTTSTDTSRTTSRQTAAPRRLRRLVAVVTLAVASVAGGLAATTATASAAQNSAVSFCTSANTPVYLYHWTSSGWAYANRSGSSGSTGCTKFYRVESDRYYVVLAYQTRGSGSSCLTNPYGFYATYGFTSYAYASSGQLANVGRATMNNVLYLCG